MAAATPHVLSWNGITPVFADIDPETLTIDPDVIEPLITSATTGILGVHVYGTPCAVERIDQKERIGKRRADAGGIGFLGDDGAAGQDAGKSRHDHRFGLLIGNRHRRVVGFGDHVAAGIEIAHLKPAGRKHGFSNTGTSVLHIQSTLAAPVFEAAYDDKRETPRRWLPG